jgi:Domain of unknown function (DUF2760)
VADAPIPLARRLWLALACFFRVLVDGTFARRTLALLSESTEVTPRAPARIEVPAPSNQDAALTLLAIFQREGRLVDFVRQDVDSFTDADIGAAARVVHAGCRRALSSHFDIVKVRDEAEGATITVLPGETASVKLTGSVSGAAPYRGVLRHAGWRVQKVNLPDLVSGHDVTIVCPAEVEL